MLSLKTLNVLQCVAVCYSVLQCVVASWKPSLRVAEFYGLVLGSVNTFERRLCFGFGV